MARFVECRTSQGAVYRTQDQAQLMIRNPPEGAVLRVV
jgi:hypothetical protein